MNDNNAPDSLGVALRKLESDLESPVVPGELSTWIRNLRASCDAVGRVLCEAVEKSHEERFRQISEQDPALLPRVQQLRHEDQELLRDCETVAREISHLEKQNADHVANQPNSDEKVAEIVERGLAFVIRMRTQEASLSTWYMEAFQRDRGVVD